LFFPSIGGPEHVADTGLCQDIFGPLRIGFDLLSKLANINPKILCIGRLIPKFRHQKLVGEHLSQVLNAQQVIFLWRKLCFAIMDFDDASNEVDRKIDGPEDRAFAWTCN
jgi:hypothetical protein